MTTDREDGSWQNSSDNAYGWSGPSTDSGCHGSLHYIHGLNAGWGGGGCSASANGTVPATYESYWVQSIFYGDFYAQEPLTYESSCSGDGSSVPWNDFSFKAWCDVPGADPATAQAVVVTCTDSSTTSNPGESGTHTETYTIRMRRTVCDRSVDSDGDDLADCTEFSLSTETHNPDTDDDRLTDGAEVLIHGTDPLNLDTDGGGVQDGDEVDMGTDPIEPTDDYGDCRYVNTSFVAKWADQETRDTVVSPDQLPDDLRYSWDDLRYCYDGTNVRILSTGTQRGEIADSGDLTAVLDLLGMKFKFAGSDQVSVERLSDNSLEARVQGTFKFCAHIPLVGAVIGKGTKLVLKVVPERMQRRLLEWGPKKIFSSSLIPEWVKDKIIRRGIDAVLDSFGALNDIDRKAVMDLFKSLVDKVGGNTVALLTDGVCRLRPWEPEIIVRVFADGTYDTFDQGSASNFWIIKDY